MEYSKLRVAGRITGGRFSLGGATYELERNDPPNHLHGGSNALDKRVWRGEPETTPEGEAVVLRAHSPDGDQGYPGNADFELRVLAEAGANALRLEYRVRVDVPTPISPTNHTYFNLDGPGAATADDNHLRIDADAYTPCDDKLTLLGRVEPVDGTPADFREPRRLGDVVPRLTLQHGDNYLVRRAARGDRELVRAARATSPHTGITLDVATTADCLQFFGGHYIDPDPPGRDGSPFAPRAGFCLETQEYPDGANHPEIADIIATPDAPYRQTTVWRFGAAWY